MQKNFVFAAVATSILALSVANAGENKSPDIDGVSNGASLKFNQNCLDIAYKNAYGEASGKPTTSNDYKNYKCYINKKVVPCQSMTEDGQTKKAETDYQNYRKETARDITGEITISSWTADGEIYYGTAWRGSNSSQRELLSNPKGVVTGLLYKELPDGTTNSTIDISIDMKTLNDVFPRTDQSGLSYTSDQGLTIAASNGKSYTFHNYKYWDDGGGRHYQFYTNTDGDVIGLKESLDKNLTFKITW